MISVVDIELIKKMHNVQGKSQRAIAKELGIHRNTVKKALEADVNDPPRYQLGAPKPAPVLDPFKPIIIQILEEDKSKPKKQRHTAKRLYERLRNEYGYRGSYSTVKRFTGQVRKEQPEIFMPLEFDPGENAQADFGAADIIEAGERQQVPLFCFKLSYSGLPFVLALPNQSQEAFFEGHKRAFEFIVGVPKSITYDNLKAAVKKLLAGKNREEQEAFTRFKAHYLFESDFCNPARGNEKGRVENLVGYVRRNVLVPIPEVDSLDELNQLLLDWCLKDKERAIAEEILTIGEKYQHERPELLPLPLRPFDCCKTMQVKSTKTALVNYDTVTYSVPVAYGQQDLTLKAYVDRVDIYHSNVKIASHPRSYKRHDEVLNFWHYLDLLKTKPGALHNSKPFRHGGLDPVFQEVYWELKARHERPDKEMIKILELGATCSPELLTKALKIAYRNRTFSFEAVAHILRQLCIPNDITREKLAHCPSRKWLNGTSGVLICFWGVRSIE